MSVAALPAERLQVVTELAATGVRPILLRKALGLDAKTWAAMMKPDEDGNPSPLAEAVELGVAQACSESLAIIRAAAAGGDVKAAMWLAEKVHRIGAETPSADSTPRIQIVLNAPMELDAFRALGDTAQPPVPPDQLTRG